MPSILPNFAHAKWNRVSDGLPELVPMANIHHDHAIITRTMETMYKNAI
jgi:hypothetical protein